MKKLLVLIALALFLASCTAEESPVKCARIISKGWNPEKGDYIKIEGNPSNIYVPNKNNYELNEIYCL